jgi:hypothetical protein
VLRKLLEDAVDTTQTVAQRNSRIKPFACLLAWGLLLGAASHAQAAAYYAIVANLNNANVPLAQLDVGVDTLAEPGGAPAPILFNVFAADGASLADFWVETNPNGFTSSAFAPPPYNNLCTLSQGQPALVKATTPSTGGLSGATLRQSLKPSNVVLAVPKARRQDGTPLAEGELFAVATGEFAKATLLVANVSSSDVAVDIFSGRRGPAGGGKYATPMLRNNAIWIVDIDPADANSNLVIASTAEIIVQFAVDEGKKGAVTEMTVLPVY